MWRSYCLLSLTLCTFELAAYGRSAGTEELVTRDDGQDHRKETRGRPEAWDENTAELVGKWRNNGEALEPKWRDGDTIPLLPFSQFSRFSRGKIDNSEEEDDYDRRTPKYRQGNRRENFLRTRNNHRSPYNDYDHGPTEIKREYHERDEISPRKRNRPWNSENAAAFEETRNDDRNRNIEEDKETSARHREIFQARPNDYEHELNDEEYLKPRPRKRRPPQNYEFTLVESETSLNEGRTSNNSGPLPRENPPETTTKNAPFLQNAVELKSLLKMQQEEGSSLSEILQRRNLTLNDLLKGKADVINALKMKDEVEEGQDYEETARIMTNSFTKLVTTERPQWTFTTSQKPTKAKSSERNEEELVIPIVPASASLRNSQTSAREPLNKANGGEVVNVTTGKSIPSNVDATRVAITTSVPLPVATNSMELMQADDAGAKSSDGGEIRAESFDEDEIMEFSDFTDYKKGRNGVSPVWLMMKDGETPKLASTKGHFEDRGSTLSIEKILRPTERSKLTNNLPASPGNQGQGFNDSNSINRNRMFKEEEQRVTVNYSEEDYGSSSEREYQSDTPDTVMYYDLEQSTQIGNFTDMGKSESDMSKTIMKELESALDAMSRDVNSTLENRRALSKSPLAEKNDSDNLKNHQNRNTTGKKSYDDIISEVEPEARAEIFELFASGSAGKRLERLLKSRNMSLEELIALRQRGSSKVHLAEVSRIRAHKSNDKYAVKDTDLKATDSSPSKEGKAIVNHDKGVDNYLSQSTENLKTIDSLSNSMDLVRLEDGTTEQLVPKLESKVSNEDIEFNTSPKMDIEKDERERHRTVEIVDLLTTFDSFPFIRDIQREFTDQYDKEEKRKLLVQDSNVGVIFMNNDAEMIRVNDTSNVVESGFVKEIVKQEPSSIDIQAVYGKTGNILDEDESRSKKGKSLSKVKPSIIASGAILGVTLVVFLAIFIVCRIRQKQKYRYKNTFSRAVFQGPVMTARKLSNSSSLSTVMVNVVATSTTKRPEKNENQKPTEMDSKSDIDNDSLDANDSWETIPDYMK
ncbi:hypothetical protein QLX08_002182 [Tetragonisca angustula]|uniref:Uncharacterized protein n=1 Tax=Tetragonisca angustula TaxID=166442 RepID=A0AAW1AF64_9HYME